MKYASQKIQMYLKLCVCGSARVWPPCVCVGGYGVFAVQLCLLCQASLRVCVSDVSVFVVPLVRMCLCVCVAIAVPSSLVAHNGPTHLPLTQRILHKRRSPNGPTSLGKRISVTSSK